MAKKSKTTTPDTPWESVLASLQTNASGGVFFIKEGKTRVRLVLEEGAEPQEFFREVKNRYGTTKYLVLGVVLDAEGRDIPAADENKVRPILIPKTALQDVVSNLAEGFPVFDLEGGHGLSINRTGSGLNTKYQVTMSPAAVSLDPDELEWPEDSLDDIATKFTERSLEQASGEGGSGGGEKTEADW